MSMRAFSAALASAARPQTLRAAWSLAGMSELASAGGYNLAVEAELVDGAGTVIGRMARMAAPAAGAYGPGLIWYCRLYAAGDQYRPLGEGNGDTPQDAAAEALSDLRERATRVQAFLAERVAAFYAG